MRAGRLLWVGVALLVAGCDFVVPEGEEIVLGNRGLVLGVNRANAVFVDGGSVVVQDADVSGRGGILARGPGGAFPMAGEAILAVEGRVRIVQGTVSGGNVVGTDESGPLDLRTLLAPALFASGSEVEISGGTLVSSGVFGVPTSFIDAAALEVTSSSLRIAGGRFLPGMRPAGQAPSRVVDASLCGAQISGGDFTRGVVQLSSCRSSITGGRFDAVVVQDIVSQISPRTPGSGGLLTVDPGSGAISIQDPSATTPAPAIDPLTQPTTSCTEIRGGTFRQLRTLAGQGPARVIVFGTDFSVPAGDLSPGPGATGELMLRLQGRFADGSPIDVDVSIAPATRVTLAAPGAPGC